MIENFGNRIAKDIWEKEFSKKLPNELSERAKALLTIMHATSNLSELRAKGEPPSLRLHQLKGDRSGQLAIDINKTSGWRITFRFENGKFLDVKIEDYHC
jgi:proteic killer suppression protein